MAAGYPVGPGRRTWSRAEMARSGMRPINDSLNKFLGDANQRDERISYELNTKDGSQKRVAKLKVERREDGIIVVNVEEFTTRGDEIGRRVFEMSLDQTKIVDHSQDYTASKKGIYVISERQLSKILARENYQVLSHQVFNALMGTRTDLDDLLSAQAAA